MAPVVVGDGPDALRVASALAATGATPRVLLRPTRFGPAWARAGSGALRVAAASADRALGALVEGGPPRRGVLLGGRVRQTPLPPGGLAWFGPGAAAGVFGARARARSAMAMAELVGGGAEERTYADWVSRRMGTPALEGVYAGYARRRFGVGPDELGAAVARSLHVPPEVAPALARPAAGFASLEDAPAGVPVEWGVDVAGFEVVDGRVVAVIRRDGPPVPTPDGVWACVAPPVVTDWLGSALPVGVHTLAAAFRAAPAARVRAPRPALALPDELHVLDDTARFWRVVVPAADPEALWVDFTFAPGAIVPPRGELVEAAAAGLASFGAEGGEAALAGAEVAEIEGGVPLWTPHIRARLRDVHLALRPFGVVPAGRLGAWADLDAAEDLALARGLAVADADPREVHRAQVDPPARLRDLLVSSRAFVHR